MHNGRSTADRTADRSRVPLALCAALAVVCASGAGCPQVLQQYTNPIPRALPASPSLAQVVDIVNDNSSKVQSLSVPRATVTMPGVPSLNANIAFVRPRSFRLVAQKFVGAEFDLGSNDELLWFWIRRAQPPALYYCRHDQYAASAARQMLPVEPEWLIEALGVVTFDKTQPIEGPFPIGNGRVEIRTKTVTSTGPISRVVVIDDTIAIRPMALLSIGFDHRVIDGAIADEWLHHVQQTLEHWDPTNA